MSSFLKLGSILYYFYRDWIPILLFKKLVFFLRNIVFLYYFAPWQCKAHNRILFFFWSSRIRFVLDQIRTPVKYYWAPQCCSVAENQYRAVSVTHQQHHLAAANKKTKLSSNYCKAIRHNRLHFKKTMYRGEPMGGGGEDPLHDPFDIFTNY